jgi:hypothetical protein
LNFKPSPDSKTCIEASTPVGAFMVSSNGAYGSRGWSTSDGGKTFKKNEEFNLDINCYTHSADVKTCLSCNVLSETVIN